MNLKELLVSKQLPIQHRFYNLITLLYAAVGVIGFVVCSVFHVQQGITWGTLVFSMLCLIFCGLAKVTENYNLWAVIFYICINVVLMPIAYLKMGGFHVGADVWIIASIILGMHILPKKMVYILLGPVFLVYAALFYMVYRHPGAVWQVNNEDAALFIVAVSVTVASVGLSLMLLYQRNQYEEQLKLNGVKEKELERLIEELKKSKEQTARINVAKTGFLKGMSDGMNAPLSVILEKGEQLATSDDEDSKKLGMEINSAGKNISAVIVNIVDLSMIESGEFTLKDEVYSLRKEIGEIHDVMKVQAEKKQLRMVFENKNLSQGSLRGDIQRIRQIIMNLLSNAIRYTAVGEVRLKIEEEKAGEKTVRLNVFVSDTGIGIKNEDLDSIFYRFHTDEKDLNSGFDSVGLGLTVSNQILQLMGSKLEVTSDYGQGTTFSFSLIQRVEETETIAEEKETIAETKEEKDNFEELLAVDVRKIKEDMEGVK